MNLEIPEYEDADAKDLLEEHLPRLKKIIPKLFPDLIDEQVTLFLSRMSKRTNTPNTVLWFLTDVALVAVTEPFREGISSIEYVRYRGRIDWLRLRGIEYDFDEGKPDSELLLEFSTEDGYNEGLSAWGKGCDHLQEIWKKYFISNYSLDPKE